MFRSILASYPSVALNTRRIPCHPLPLYNPPPCIYIPVKFAASKDSLEPSEIEPLYLNQLLFIPMSSPSSNFELGGLIYSKYVEQSVAGNGFLIGIVKSAYTTILINWSGWNEIDSATFIVYFRGNFVDAIIYKMCGNNFSNKSFYINNGSIFSKGMYDGNLSIFTFDQTHKFEAVGEKAEIPSSAILLTIN